MHMYQNEKYAVLLKNFLCKPKIIADNYFNASLENKVKNRKQTFC